MAKNNHIKIKQVEKLTINVFVEKPQQEPQEQESITTNEIERFIEELLREENPKEIHITMVDAYEDDPLEENIHDPLGKMLKRLQNLLEKIESPAKEINDLIAQTYKAVEEAFLEIPNVEEEKDFEDNDNFDDYNDFDDIA